MCSVNWEPSSRKTKKLKFDIPIEKGIKFRKKAAKCESDWHKREPTFYIFQNTCDIQFILRIEDFEQFFLNILSKTLSKR